MLTKSLPSLEAFADKILSAKSLKYIVGGYARDTKAGHHTGSDPDQNFDYWGDCTNGHTTIFAECSLNKDFASWQLSAEYIDFVHENS